MRSARKSGSSALAFATLLGLAACGSDGGGRGPSGGGLPGAQAWVLGDITATTLGEMSPEHHHFELNRTGAVTAAPVPPSSRPPGPCRARGRRAARRASQSSTGLNSPGAPRCGAFDSQEMWQQGVK